MGGDRDQMLAANEAKPLRERLTLIGISEELCLCSGL
jgi:hypothetical protein